jgi:hypothetical protein
VIVLRSLNNCTVSIFQTNSAAARIIFILHRLEVRKIMAKIKVYAGDFLKETGEYTFGAITLKTTEHPWMGESIRITELEYVEAASEEAVKKVGGTVGWGVAGAVLLGPVGLLAGLLLGGKKTEVTFVAKFKDGRKLLASTDSKTFTKFRAATFS